MSAFDHLQGQLIEKLRAVEKKRMEDIAREFAQIEFPDRFDRADRPIKIIGHNAEGQTHEGWPDAGVILPDGRIDAIEATRAKKNPEVLRHLKDDLRKGGNPKHPKLAGFLFVAGYPDIKLKPQETRDSIRGFVELGLDPDKIQIYCGMDFVARLAHPKFARLRHNVLGIPSEPKYFRLIRSRGNDRRRHDFEPSLDEFIQGAVYRPAIAGEVEERLNRSGAASVVGRGASGKTVLAYLIALDGLRKHLPTFYLDLADASDGTLSESEIASALVDFNDPSVLFIVDNMHLNEQLAAGIHDSWNEQPASYRPQLLFLGREVQRARRSPWFMKNDFSLVHRAGDGEIRGVFRRLAGRKLNSGSTGREIPSPPDYVVNDWKDKFGGRDKKGTESAVDLIALGAAIERRLGRDQLLNGNWQLERKDAAEEIASRYLDYRKISKEEITNLLWLAALPEDFRIPKIAIPEKLTGFPESVKSGLVFETQHGRGEHVYYRFAHSALGSLIFEAAADKPDRDDVYRRIVASDSFAGIELAKVLSRDDNRDLAGRLLVLMTSKPNWLDQYGGHLGHLRRAFELLEELNLFGENFLVNMLSKRKRLVEIAMKSSPDLLANFLNYGERRDLQGIRKAVIEGLEEDQNRVRLVANALDAPLDLLANFLRYAARRDMQVIRKAVIDGLEKDKRRLVAKVRKGPLEHVVNFLDCAERRDMQEIRGALIDCLGRDKKRLIVNAQLSSIASFLTHIKPGKRNPGLPEIYADLLLTLSDESQIQNFADSARRESLDKVLGFLNVFPYASRVVAAIDREKWDECRSKDLSTQPGFFVEFANKLSEFDRVELGVIPARNLIVRCEAAHWQASGIDLRHLSHVLRLADGVDEEQTKRFVEFAVADDWLDRQYRVAHPGTIAGAIYSITASVGRRLGARFLRPSLEARVASELRRNPPGEFEDWACALSLLGAFVALGGDTSRLNSELWPDDAALAFITATRNSALDQKNINANQMQLLFGLREMARLRSDAIRVPRHWGESMLSFLRQAKPSNEIMVEMNRSMAIWLESCAQANWVLARH